MRSNKLFFIALLFMVGNLYSQLEISLYTDKTNYEYGEKIELSCKITNPADTTFKFFAGSHNSCQAEFSFNDFNSWEHTQCATTTQLLVFKPFSSLLYKWIIDPMFYGLPNREGVQQIIGTYYFDLIDTIYINAPQFLGGQLSVGYSKEYTDSIQQIKDSLGIDVINQSDYGDRFLELWQVLGYQIDSLIARYDEDTIFNYVEKAVTVEYESMKFEDPLEYYPLQIGNKWTYKVFDVNTWENDTSDTYYYRTDEVVGVAVLNDGYNYFEIKQGEVSSYYLRVDPVAEIIYDPSGYEFYNLGVNPDSLWIDNAGVTNNMYYDTSRVGELDIIRPMMVYQTGYFFFNRTLAKGIGLSFQETGDLGLHTLEILVYAKIDGVEYGNIKSPLNYYPLHVGDVKQFLVEEGNSSRDTSYYITSKIVGTETIDGKEYFLLSDGLVDCYRYIRIDSSNATVWEIMCGTENECMVDSLEMIPNSTGFINDCYGIVYCISDTNKILFGEERGVKAFQWVAPLTCVYCPYRDYQYAEGIGQIYSKFVSPAPEGFESEYRIRTLTYAKIDGVEYGDIDTSQHTDFFPLQIGNRWQYSEGSGEVLESKAIGDTTMSNSLTYIKVQGVFFSGYFRKEDSRVYSYNTILNEEELAYDFSLKAGDTLSVKVIDQDTIITSVSSIGYTEKFGENRKYFNYLHELVNASEAAEERFIDGLGFSQKYWLLSYGLTGAVIDGVVYGKIVNVKNSTKILPTEFSLQQNYPNPFNPSTTIKYSIPSIERDLSRLNRSELKSALQNVTLKVYDILGREVTTLVNKEQSAGNYEVQFDASNLSSGVYYYRLQYGGFTQTKKMIILR